MQREKKEKERKIFEQVWEACSQMDVPIQRLFNADLRKKYFGESYDGFNPPFNDGEILESNVIQNDFFSIEDILQMVEDTLVVEDIIHHL